MANGIAVVVFQQTSSHQNRMQPRAKGVGYWLLMLVLANLKIVTRCPQTTDNCRFFLWGKDKSTAKVSKSLL
jgi:hypothetical protein